MLTNSTIRLGIPRSVVNSRGQSAMLSGNAGDSSPTLQSRLLEIAHKAMRGDSGFTPGLVDKWQHSPMFVAAAAGSRQTSV